jgi:insecticidal toxin complex protein TccC
VQTQAPKQTHVRRSRADGWPWLRSALRTFGVGRRGRYALPSAYPLESVLAEPDQFRALGFHPDEADAFQRLANWHRYDIFVRSSHVSRVGNVGRPGLRPKPAGVYQKTNKASFAAGLVVYRDGEESKWTRDLERINHPDPAHAPLALRVLASEGLHVWPLGSGTQGLRDGAGNFFYGDIDIHGVYRRTGAHQSERIDARTFVPQFNMSLMATGLHASDLLECGTPMEKKEFGVLPHSPVQHGAHDEWSERNDASYAGGVNMGPLPGVVHFRPGVTARYVATVPHYKDILASLGQAHLYTSAAWSNGRNRLAAARYSRSSSAPQLSLSDHAALPETTRL